MRRFAGNEEYPEDAITILSCGVLEVSHTAGAVVQRHTAADRGEGSSSYTELACPFSQRYCSLVGWGEKMICILLCGPRYRGNSPGNVGECIVGTALARYAMAHHEGWK